MTACDALIVGGGPAGSTCARFLRLAGWNVIVMDRAAFPRDKVCAGWVTPHVFAALELNPDEYRAAGLTLQDIRRFHTGVLGRPLVATSYPHVVSYAIRRCEFDHFLLMRARPTAIHTVPMTSLERVNDAWVANGEFVAPVVIGAGGHFCPVARRLRPTDARSRVVIAKEAEVRLQPDEEHDVLPAPQLFFCHDLDGYAWCVRKGDYVNIGIGRRHKGDFGRHVDAFARFLEDQKIFARASKVSWKGHAYLANGAGTSPLVDDGVMLVGDAAGLAYPESGEGIRPAVESARLAAETLIAGGGRVDRATLASYETTLRQKYPSAATDDDAWRPAKVAVGRTLLGSKIFTRRILLDRWFLRA